MFEKLKALLLDENGGVVEQAIIIGVLAIAGASFFFLVLRPILGEIFGDIGDELDNW